MQDFRVIMGIFLSVELCSVGMCTNDSERHAVLIFQDIRLILH
jgi:hypothetical protein